MIDVNITIMVQTIHFFIAWWLLDRFFFRFVVDAIQKEENVTKKLNRSIKKKMVFLSEEEEREAQLLKGYRKKFKKGAPTVEMTPTLSYSAVLCPVWLEIKPEKKKKLMNEASELLVKRILDDA